MPVAEQMTMEALGVGLGSLLPERLVRRLDAAGPPPSEVSFQGAALFADISGYTRLAEVLLAKADEGLGELSAILSDAFARYVALVDAHGGEIVYFAGDSILVYWAADGGTTTAECVRRAESCATELVLASHRAGEGGTRLHCGVGSGRLWAARVGGRDGCWHLVFGGSAVRDATRAGAAARPGETIVVQGAPSHREVSGATDLVEARAIERLGGTEGPEPRPLSSPPSSLVPRVMLERAASGRSDLGELRQITAVFARFEGFDEAENCALSRMQHLASEAHRAVEAFSGATGRWVIDDKGLVFFVVFGVPYNAHADDPLRAVSAALSMREAPWPEGMRCGVGVASGRAFCGAIGGAARREFMTVGRPMIVAARLMVAGEDVQYSGRPPVDDERSDIVFVAAPPLLAKGFTDPLPIFIVRRRAAGPPARATVYGRARETAMLRDLLVRAIEGPGGVVLVRGEAGIGKSCLVAELVDFARENAGLRPLLGKSEPVEYTPTLLPWRRIFRSLLGRGKGDDLPALREALGEWLAARVDLAPFGPLLNAVLGLDLAETDATQHLRGPRRVETMVRVMVDVLAQAAPGPRVVVLEDCHWMDGDSWRLAQAVARLPMTFTILTARPTPLPSESSWLGDHPALCEVDLGPLDPADTERMVRERLDAKSVSSHLAAAVQGRSGGHPLMAIEYALLLRESHGMAEHDGHYALRVTSEPATESHPPASVQAVVASRIDSLDGHEQMALKVASAIGQKFSLAMLHRVLPAASSKGVLDRLIERQLVQRLPEADAFAFRHSVVREVAYGLMLVNQRRELHGAIARALEQDGPGQDCALLAHHFYHACDYDRAVANADAAADRALQIGAYREAAYFLDLCERVGARGGMDEDADTVTRRRRQLADAYHGLGDLVARRRHARRALAAAGQEAEPSKATQTIDVTARLSRRLVPSMGRFSRRGSPPPALRSLDIARAYLHMNELAYFDNDALAMVWASVNAIEAAEQATPSPELSLAYAQLGGSLGLAGVHPLARRFVQNAIRAAGQANAPHAEAYAHMINALYMVGLGSWAEARASVERCQNLRLRTHDHVTWNYAEVVRFWTHQYRDEVAEARSAARRLRVEADRTGHVQHAAWSLRCEGLLDARSGALASAVRLLEEARSLLSDTKDTNELIMVHGALGLARLGLGNRNAAIESASLALRLGSGTRRPTNHATLTGLTAAVEVFVALWRRELREPTWRACAAEGIEALQRHRGVFPITEPSFRYWRGYVRALSGRQRLAVADWRRGLTASRTLGMPVEERLLSTALAAGYGAAVPR